MAKGAIELNLSRLQSQRQVVVSSMRQMGQSIEKGFNGASSAVLSFDKRLQSLNGRIDSIRGELTALSVGGAALSGFGLKAADHVNTLNIRFRELTGNQADAVALMNEIATAAKKVGLPVRQTQQDFVGLIPAIRDAGGEVDTYLNLVSRLALLNKSEGTSGATFAIREALTSGNTDLVSLAERFNISKSALRELIAETGSFSEALDILLDKQGATTEAAEANARSIAGASARFRDAGQRALERGFTPYVEGAASALDGLASAIESAPDGLLQIGAGATLAVTGISAMALATSQLITTYQNLKTAGFFTSFASVGKNVARAGVLVGAAAVGAGIGIAGVRAAGRATGDERLANFDLQQAGETLKQALFLIVNALIEGGRLLGLGIGQIINAFQTIPQSFDIFRAQLEIAFAGILIAFEDAKRFLTGDTRQRGARGEGGFSAGVLTNRLPETAGDRLLAQGQARLNEAVLSQNSRAAALDEEVNAQFDAMQLAAARAFGFIESEAETTADTVEETVNRAQLLQEAYAASQAKANAEFLAGLTERISFEQDYLELLREGSPEQIQDRLQALADEKAAIEQFLPELQEVAKTSEEGAVALAEYQARLAAIDEQATRFGDAMITASTKAIKMLDTDFQAEVAKIEAEREKAIGEALADLQKGLTELDADVLSKSKELRAENVEALQEYQDAERDIIAKHREKVLEIERKSREDITDAAARLDAAGVFSARKRRDEQLTEANKGLNEERAKNAEKLAETQRNLAQEALQLQAYYVERRNALLIENQTELAQLNAKFNAEITTAQTAYQTERNQLNQHLQTQLAARAAAQARENSILAQGLQAAQNLFGRFTNGIMSQLSGMQGASKSIGSQIASYSPAAAQPVLSYATNGMTFATGGVASFAGSGSAWAMVENKERILTPQQNANFERLITAISGTQSPASGNGIPSNLTVDVTGVDSFEMLVGRVTRQVLGQIYEARLG